MKLKYNAPVTFSFALISLFILVIDQYLFPGLIGGFFSAPGADFNPSQATHYTGLLFHVFGHQNWTHLWNNFLFIFLLGPILEEKYAPKPLLFMMASTALVSGIFNILLRQPTLVGASSIVFMMIMLVSFARTKPGEIPLSFILIFVLYLLSELTAGVSGENPGVSNTAHIVGGICGVIFGFMKMIPKESASSPPPA